MGDSEHRCQGHASRLLSYLQERVAGSRQILFFCDPVRVPFYKKRGARNFKKRKFNKALRDIKGMPAECLTMEFPKATPSELKGKPKRQRPPGPNPWRTLALIWSLGKKEPMRWPLS
eukprot:TRINITY_DN3656_c0_g1_i1.p1 TRINITY_DN3656_c0_g1~~TRINITY_DN3656_c0_g1_i1.p1  ORF type:complete len:117 (-),score=5.55 TRINITY_DN3656_c0_g1_i1:236-586(-)